ncbi:sensor histidine kinase [Salinarimonas soli]|uniref:sensor histidine kinase n=1 Tax=Salinarimonas soli TaxID=1638099 RepID=UPI001F0A749B|nr:PAS domain-containing sensor histidine kinase [Salinarimonas soli]
MFEGRLAGLVHESVQDDAVERTRHERFIASRMGTGLIALGLLPLYLVLRGVPSPVECLVILCLAAPLFGAAILSRSGRLDIAHAISSASLAVLVVCIAGSSGGLTSPASIWLLAIPLEAALSGSRRAALAATIVAVAAALALVALELTGVFPLRQAWPAAIATPVFAIAAIAHAAAVALVRTRGEDEQRLRIRARDAQDRSLLQAIDDLITWHDRTGAVVKASPASQKLLGVGPGSLQGRGLFARVHVSDRPAYLKAISDAASGDRAVAAQFRLHAGVGDESRVVWVEMRAHRVVDAADADAPAVVAVTRDICERKSREEDLDLARARAERADELKASFLATVSHELRTPLNAIIGFSEILATETGTVDEARRRDYARIIHESGHHLLAVVNTLLDMSKIETGNFDVVPEPFDMAALVGGCCDLMRLKAEQGGVTIAREIAAEIPEIVADRRACKQILINLLSNAVKFTPSGGCVTATLRRERDQLVIAVTDTGVGVPETDLPKLGNPFFQANSSYSRAHEGTGLGLSVVRGLVGLHQGTMTIESQMGEGTRVTVSLPLDCRAGVPRGAAIPVQTSARLHVLQARDKGVKKIA